MTMLCLEATGHDQDDDTTASGHVLSKAQDISLKPPSTWKNFTVKRDLIPDGKFGRSSSYAMNPRYITIHSTQNFANGADAKAHARGLREGNFKSEFNKLGFLTWHFTTDQDEVIQSIPCNERGQHADYEGPGNQLSLGIEMCEHPNNNRQKTLDKTARLCALLMAEYGIPLQHVVPHQHWRRIRHKDKRDIGHKNCPHFLMENGKPGKKWNDFLNLVLQHYKSHPKFNIKLVSHPGSVALPASHGNQDGAYDPSSTPKVTLPDAWLPTEKPTKEDDPK